jgi:diphthamide synthase (EF-2-diphthine--ammonia ligase)
MATNKTSKPVLVSWSGGKDSCLALYEIQRSHEFAPAALLTTITEGYDRISMHGVRRDLLEAQAASLGIPLQTVVISKSASNEEYEAKLIDACSEYRVRGIDAIVFGDLFLEDVKKYRDEFLTRHKLRGLTPFGYGTPRSS